MSLLADLFSRTSHNTLAVASPAISMMVSTPPFFADSASLSDLHCKPLRWTCSWIFFETLHAHLARIVSIPVLRLPDLVSLSRELCERHGVCFGNLCQDKGFQVALFFAQLPLKQAVVLLEHILYL